MLISLKKVEQLTAGSDSLCVDRGLSVPFMQKRYLYGFPKNYRKAEYLLFRPSNENLRKVRRIDYEIVLKTRRMILLRNLSFGAKGSADDGPR